MLEKGTSRSRTIRKAPSHLLAPALLAALVVSDTFADEGHVVVDERAIGVALALQAPMLLAGVLAVIARGGNVAYLSARTSPAGSHLFAETS